MGVLDDLVSGFARVVRWIDLRIEGVTNPTIGDEEVTDAGGQIAEAVTPVDEGAGNIVDLVEEAVLADLQQAGELDPENVKSIMDDVEGGQVAFLLGVLGSSTALEIAGATGLDSHEELVAQLAAAFAFDEATGTELQARIQEGVLPALEAKVAKEHRSKFVNLQDAVEYALRNKEADEGFLRGRNVDQDVVNQVGSTDPVNRNNLVEEWGIRDDNVPILEAVSIKALEPEEILEEPIQYGIIPSEETLEEELDRAGVSENAKELYQEVREEGSRSADIWEQKTTTEELVRRLDERLRNGTISVEEAMALLPEDADQARDALQERFQLTVQASRDKPSDSDILDAFAHGQINVDTAVGELNSPAKKEEEVARAVAVEALEELDGDLRTALGLGLINEARYTEIAEVAGLDQEAVDSLLAGQDLDEIALARLRDEGTQTGQSVTAILGIGDSRGSALAADGLETVQDLADADPERVAEVAQVSLTTAERFVQAASRRVG